MCSSRVLVVALLLYWEHMCCVVGICAFCDCREVLCSTVIVLCLFVILGVCFKPACGIRLRPVPSTLGVVSGMCERGLGEVEKGHKGGGDEKCEGIA